MTQSLQLLTTSAWELPIDYQRVRHSAPAEWLRGAIYRLFVGDEGWPLVFRPPVGDVTRKTSEHLYVHLPFCRQICPHCPYNKTLNRHNRHESYASALGLEIEDYFRGSAVPPSRSTVVLDHLD